ncbi:cytochrome c oxidase assembly protein subunit 15 [Paenibacillus eucommiae]|uniref:Cytochrome c oxidase assembly protein subunit 15 n=1 Tax=Paenibacillus eucommiae TaxID=1355755 RepID=A0ABS4IWT9_9BACL|nr:COX15/CtaA family protein [Paenibacillus eucommiae]MBP1992025.1 cytochrome c oxidase assembly protein subunit 15 [Paenibacillus eucommiae]
MKQLANWSAIGMFLILIMGALVTKTDSGRGCGDDWPLCNGKFIPAYTISSFIEYSHRLVVGVVTLLLMATIILVFRYVKRKDAKLFVTGAVLFTIIQAIMGAMAVNSPQSATILALHFGLSLLAFACTLLLALVFTKWGGYASPYGLEAISEKKLPLSFGNLKSTAQPVKSGSITGGFRIMVWGTAVFCYVVVYLGAFVRHSESSGGCAGWPLCNGQIIPEISGATGIVFTHRVAALLLFICILTLFLISKKSTDYSDRWVQGSKWTLILVLTQIISGAIVTWAIGDELLYLLTGMIHAVIIACLFGMLSYLCVLTFYYDKRDTSKI